MADKLTTLWLQEDAASGKLSATFEKPERITGRIIAITIRGTFKDVTDGGFFTVQLPGRPTGGSQT